MSENIDKPIFMQSDAEAIASAVQRLATQYQGNPQALLGLLRMLEALHRDIRDGLFQDCLPNNRQILYAMLKDIEAEGGWPYIPRMKLRSLLTNMLVDEDNDEFDAEAVNPDMSP